MSRNVLDWMQAATILIFIWHYIYLYYILYYIILYLFDIYIKLSPKAQVNTTYLQRKDQHLCHMWCYFQIGIRVACGEELECITHIKLNWRARSPPYYLCPHTHQKNSTQGGDKHCEAMHFNSLDLTFRMLHWYIFKSIRYFLKNYLITTEIARDLVVT